MARVFRRMLAAVLERGVRPILRPALLRDGVRAFLTDFVRRGFSAVFEVSAVHSVDPPRIYPGGMIRVLAKLVDYVVVIAADAALVGAFYFAGTAALGRAGFAASLAVAFFVPFISAWLYFTLFEWSRWHATPGAKLCRLSLLSVDGSPVGFIQANVRYLSRILSGIGFCLGYLFIFCTPRRQAFHDIVSGTVLVRRVSAAAVERLLETHPEDAGRFRAPSVPVSDVVLPGALPAPARVPAASSGPERPAVRVAPSAASLGRIARLRTRGRTVRARS